MCDDTLKRKAAVLQEARQIFADKAIDDETGRDDDNRWPYDAPASQQHKRNAEAGHESIQLRVSTGTELQRLIIYDKIAGDADKGQAQQNIIPGQPAPVGVLGSRINDVGQGDSQAQMGIAKNLQGDSVEEGRIELEQRPQCQNDRDNCISGLVEDLELRLAIYGSEVDLFGIDFLFRE